MQDQECRIDDEARRIMIAFPEVFGKPPWRIEETNLAWGLSCGKGWYPLIESLSADLTTIVQQDDLSRFQARQVKQKLGKLRFYSKGGNDRTADRIRQAEFEAASKCEHCGMHTAELKSLGGWLTTTCDDCAAILLKSRS